MTSTVGARPNHYERLGLKPRASDEEIARAFARRASISRPMAEMAQIGLAYETLRNRAKRRAYDISIGLAPAPRPQPPHSPMEVRFRASARLVGAAAGDQVTAAAVPLSPPIAATPSRTPEHRPFIAAPPSEPVSKGPRSEPSPVPPSPAPRPLSAAEASPEIQPEDLFERIRQAGVRGKAERPIGWSRAGLAIGGVLLAAAIVGAWAGLDAGDAEELPQQRAVKAVLPPAKPSPEALAVVARQAADRLQPVAQNAAVERQIAQRRPLPRTAGQSDRLAEISQSLDSSYDSGTSAAPAVQSAAASLPLPNKVIARTIERIGYGCGEVASASPTGGGSGVYEVTCTSGHRYRATPVHGRYHFRRLSR